VVFRGRMWQLGSGNDVWNAKDGPFPRERGTFFLSPNPGGKLKSSFPPSAPLFNRLAPHFSTGVYKSGSRTACDVVGR
jgi:hypothetical protein